MQPKSAEMRQQQDPVKRGSTCKQQEPATFNVAVVVVVVAPLTAVKYI